MIKVYFLYVLLIYYCTIIDIKRSNINITLQKKISSKSFLNKEDYDYIIFSCGFL